MQDTINLLKEGYCEMADESRKMMDDFKTLDLESWEYLLKHF